MADESNNLLVSILKVYLPFTPRAIGTETCHICANVFSMLWIPVGLGTVGYVGMCAYFIT